MKFQKGHKINKGKRNSLGYKFTDEQKSKLGTHKLSSHRLYAIWKQMVNRCLLPSHKAYKWYGARGIKVCEEWQNLEKFIEDMDSTYIRGLQLDRKDNNAGYSKENCRWVSRKENLRNTRSNKVIEYRGVVKTLSEWSEVLGIPYQRLWFRLKRGQSVNKAFETL